MEGGGVSAAPCMDPPLQYQRMSTYSDSLRAVNFHLTVNQN